MLNSIYKLIERIYMWCVELLFRIIRRNLDDKTRQVFREFLQFGLVGVSNTVVSYLLYAGSLVAFGKLGVFAKIDYIVANVIAFFLSVLWSFYWNSRFVFRLKEGEERNMWSALLKTYVSYAFTGLFLNNVLSIFWVELVHINKLLAPFANMIVNIPINFFMNKLWAFKKK